MSDPAEAATGPARRRSSFGPTLVVGLAGAALATAAATRVWAAATVRDTGLRTEEATGVDVAPLVLPLALVALAAWGTVLVLRRTGRRVVAVVGLLAAAGGGAAAVVGAGSAADVARRMLGDPADASTSTTPWPLVAAVASLVSAAAFAVALRAVGGWPEMSARYDAPATARSAADRRGEHRSDADLWKALDAGEDPTA